MVYVNTFRYNVIKVVQLALETSCATGEVGIHLLTTGSY